MANAKGGRSGSRPASNNRSASSPYSTGAGGVTFERRVASFYLAALLNGETAPGLDSRRLVGVAFQQAPSEPVDDLVLTAQREGEGTPSLLVAVGVRRRPLITPTDADTQKLLTDYLRSLFQSVPSGMDREYILVVAGPQNPATQVGTLAALARTSKDDRAFYTLTEEPGRFEGIVRTRLSHLVTLVTAGLTSLALPHTTADARSATWKLLSKLTVLMPRYEAPDLSDWEQLLNTLRPCSRDQTLDSARALRDRLEVLTGTYSPQAATIDQMSLLRDVRPLITTDLSWFHPAWTKLDALELRMTALEARLGAQETGI